MLITIVGGGGKSLSALSMPLFEYEVGVSCAVVPSTSHHGMENISVRDVLVFITIIKDCSVSAIATA